jgi:hypothetical protein
MWYYEILVQSQGFFCLQVKFGWSRGLFGRRRSFLQCFIFIIANLAWFIVIVNLISHNNVVI